MSSPAMSGVVALARDLVRIDTTNPPGREAPAVRLLEARLRAAGFETRIVPYAAGEERSHVVARLRGSGQRPGLMLSGHVDVVPPGNLPWSVDPFGAELRDGRLYGRGSCDMKGGVAAMVAAAEAIARSGRALAGDLVVAITADEERNCLGAEELVREPLFEGLGGVIVAEPTGLRPFIAEKGAFWVEVTLLGKTAHGSMPELGANAVAGMAEFLTRWERLYPADAPHHPLLGRPTLNPAVIEGGVKVNVVPDRCTAQIDMRTVPGLEHTALRRALDETLAAVCAPRGLRHELRVLSDRPPVACPPDSDVALAVRAAIREVTGEDPEPGGVPYCTEMCIWTPTLGIPGVICGPGLPSMAHQPDEWVAIEQLEAAARLYERAAIRLLSL